MFDKQAFLDRLLELDTINGRSVYECALRATASGGKKAQAINAWISVDGPPFLKHMLTFCAIVMVFLTVDEADKGPVREKMLAEWQRMLKSLEPDSVSDVEEILNVDDINE